MFNTHSSEKPYRPPQDSPHAAKGTNSHQTLKSFIPQIAALLNFSFPPPPQKKCFCFSAVVRNGRKWSAAVSCCSGSGKAGLAGSREMLSHLLKKGEKKCKCTDRKFSVTRTTPGLRCSISSAREGKGIGKTKLSVLKTLKNKAPPFHFAQLYHTGASFSAQVYFTFMKGHNGKSC